VTLLKIKPAVTGEDKADAIAYALSNFNNDSFG
jgi:Holliday junction resolvasome RuvABC endonuclease subunit